MIDAKGYRANVAIVLTNSRNQVFWGKRIGQNSWQFPQGGIQPQEGTLQAMLRELREEIGLRPQDVEVVAAVDHWIEYQIPPHLMRHGQPLCIGQKQKWFLLKLRADAKKIHFDETDTPEFEEWKWVDYWFPAKEVVDFKKQVYQEALAYFEKYLRT